MADDNTAWFSLDGREWHVDIGSAVWERLSAEDSGAVLIDGPGGDPDVDQQTSDKAIADMTKKELLAFADEHDFAVADRRASNDKLIAEINAALQAEAEAANADAGGDPDAEPPKGDEA